jgi:DNA repair ATPase RecN
MATRQELVEAQSRITSLESTICSVYNQKIELEKANRQLRESLDEISRDHDEITALANGLMARNQRMARKYHTTAEEQQFMKGIAATLKNVVDFAFEPAE